MNSEELEVSLRTEFEQHLKAIRAEMKQQLSAFQSQIHGEISKHKSQIDSAFDEFATRFDTPDKMEAVLQESVVEHLRLARDNGAQLAASAAAEAEKLTREHAASVAGFDQLRDAVAAISAQTTQAGILKTLTDYATRFAPRGAFFIIKNDQFVGWQVFGSNSVSDARSVSFSVDTDSIVGSAVRCLSTQQGSYGLHSEDSKFLKPLDFGKPNSMVAMPLIARGRGVAVLYADSGADEGSHLNIGALETLVRIAGITVELQAAAQAIRTQTEAPATSESRPAEAYAPPVEKAGLAPEAYTAEAPEASAEDHLYATSEADEVTEDAAPLAEEAAAPVEAFEPVRESFREDVVEEMISVEPEATLDDEAYLMSEQEETIYADEIETVEEPEVASTEFAFASDEPAVAVEEPISEYNDGFSNGNGFAKPEPAPVVAFAGRGRRDRNVDLPIEVSDDEREEHTKARKFARLLVSEIKLYNEKQVKEGRQANDLYDRLREAVDRSREMYNKRVQPPVSAKFDYFHYELVNSLAEGDESRLGNNYPGTVN